MCEIAAFATDDECVPFGAAGAFILRDFAAEYKYFKFHFTKRLLLSYILANSCWESERFEYTSATNFSNSLKIFIFHLGLPTMCFHSALDC